MIKKVICKHCGSIATANLDEVLTSYPPMFNVDCPKCGRVYMLCDEVYCQPEVLNINENNKIQEENLDSFAEYIKNNLSLELRISINGDKYLCLIVDGDILNKINLTDLIDDGI